jgi:hypothetical protein
VAKVGHFRVLALAGLVALAALLGAASPAGALIGGEPDGEEHPYVGMAGFYDKAGKPTYGCSGTLLSPTVFLTAGHCTAGMARARVWFGSQFDLDSQAERSAGFPSSGGAAGTPYSHPNFVGSNDVLDSFPNTYDVGVVVLDQPVSIGTYGTIPGPGFLDALAVQPGQEQQSFTVVGYGLQGTHPDLLGAFQPQRQKATTQLADLGVALADGYNLLTPNNAAGWGSCYGDSGGPILLSGTSTVVAVTSFGLDPNCTGTNGGYRTDIADSQDFIRGFLG